MTPAEIVAELDKYIIGQNEAKRAVAIALRNRFRRQLLNEDMRDEVTPKNILMMGPTGVGKTEIARRVAKIVDAPFIKVEATKFTEVGYVGRDVESIIRDLVEVSISNLHSMRLEAVKSQAEVAARERLITYLLEQTDHDRRPRAHRRNGTPPEKSEPEAESAGAAQRQRRQRKKLLEMLNQDLLEDVTVEIDVEQFFDEYSDDGPYDESSYGDFLDDLSRNASRRRSRRVSVRDARRILTQQEAYRMVDFDAVVDESIRRAEDAAVVFIDEIDKTISRNGEYGADVSGEGVQRDLLPIVEGSVVMTRYGPVKTDHILFIAAGSFHGVKPSDLIPELQGRFPLRVELQSLTETDLLAILKEPRNALTKQYVALLATESVEIGFTDDGLEEMARLAADVNNRTQDIGARRLATIVERVIEQLSFDATAFRGQTITIDAAYVRDKVGDIAADEDLSNFIL
ncbi:MAG: ATP-dependent protease ATPase subunit HslU [Thermomicrobia bacterium]|nr:ATP-dependent protease ATPase subunit HslU [Thermomicrobia bacterium]MCA1724941.1 ATP-dependent protease ATPase subunit HslU [Thermomicrobia bacterium]